MSDKARVQYWPSSRSIRFEAQPPIMPSGEQLALETDDQKRARLFGNMNGAMAFGTHAKAVIDDFPTDIDTTDGADQNGKEQGSK